ncbi:replication initiation factor domain-containing protein [Oceanimonas marisflavi]|uniref:replication initiation factor domain-containing protein n=1 Tax=Oceanimonas marisflavi TaxID=2059724 RepID=UPI0013004C41|nr:replication initiation factor domain-containing protein [Oceanimonas marisflavi]
MAKVIHDYLSFTWSPEQIVRMKSLARTGAIVKTPFQKRFDGQHDWAFWRDVSDAFRREMAEQLDEAMGGAEFVAADMDYNDAYSDIVQHYGVQLLDCLCHGEVAALVQEFNLHMVPANGHGITKRFSYEPRRGGMYGYAYSATLMMDGANAGIVAWGAENGGCMVSITGAGCAGVDFTIMYQILNRLPGIKITRVDLALDDYEGKAFTAATFREMALEGLFSGRGRPPRYTYIESGHIELIDKGQSKEAKKRYGMVPNAGTSFYIGARESGKVFRAYEKGKQMQDEKRPNWQRAEVEIRSKDRVIPLDVLLRPDEFFAGAYPALAGLLEQVEPERIRTFKNLFAVDRQRAIESAATQAGRLINYLARFEGISPGEICHRLTSHLREDDIPARLNRPVSYDILSTSGTMEPAF